MWRVNDCGRIYAPGKPLAKDLRLLVISKITCAGGDPESGNLPGKFVDIARSIGITSAVVSKIWKRYCTEGNVDLRHTVVENQVICQRVISNT